MSKILGIDLGTTNSCAAIVEATVSVVLANREGSRTTASIVAFSEEGDRLVGQIAKRQAITNPENTVYAVKRLIGRKFRDSQVERARAVLPYTLAEATNGDVKIEIRDRALQPRGDLGAGAARDEGSRRGAAPGGGARGGHHRPRLLQRRPAAGHQGRRQDRRPRRRPHPQRADRRRARLRPRPAERRRTPARSPSTTSAAAPSTSRSSSSRRRRLRGALDRRRHLPRRRRLRRADHRLADRGLQQRDTASTCARTAWPSSA